MQVPNLKRRIRVFLAQHDMTQKDLADELGWSTFKLSKMLKSEEIKQTEDFITLKDATGIDFEKIVKEESQTT